jgi:hypothetical protein
MKANIYVHCAASSYAHFVLFASCVMRWRSLSAIISIFSAAPLVLCNAVESEIPTPHAFRRAQRYPSSYLRPEPNAMSRLSIRRKLVSKAQITQLRNT